MMQKIGLLERVVALEKAGLTCNHPAAVEQRLSTASAPWLRSNAAGT